MNQKPYILLQIITYDIHKARILANNLDNSVLSEQTVQYQTELKNLDCKLISGLIRYNEYQIEYVKLQKLETNTSPELFRAKKAHLGYVHEFVNMRTHLKLN